MWQQVVMNTEFCQVQDICSNLEILWLEELSVSPAVVTKESPLEFGDVNTIVIPRPLHVMFTFLPDDLRQGSRGCAFSDLRKGVRVAFCILPNQNTAAILYGKFTIPWRKVDIFPWDNLIIHICVRNIWAVIHFSGHTKVLMCLATWTSARRWWSSR